MAKQKLTPEEKAQRKADRKAKFKAMNEKNGTRWQAVKYLLCTASAGIIQFVSFTIMTYAFAKLYSDRTQWEARRDTLRREIRQRLGIDSYLDSCVVGKKAILSKVRRYDGYTVQNICIETLPGEHIYGSIYTPSKKGKHALIICPNGHFADGRYRKDQQQRMATLARMGAICVDYDIYGWGQSADEHPSHHTDRAHVIQALDGLKLLDWMLQNRAKEIDTKRIGANGGSGGGTVTILLTALDERFTASYSS